MSRSHSKGFTIIELMIASSVFAVVLIVVSTGLLQIGRLFFKGVSMTSTQEAARVVTDEVTQSIQFSGEPVTTQITIAPDGLTKGFCVGDKRYSYLKDRQLTDDTPDPAIQAWHVLVVDEVSPCNDSTLAQSLSGVAPPALTPTSRELMGARMRLAELDLQRVPLLDRSDLFSFKIRVIFGDADLLTGDRLNCSSDTAGSQFCSAAELNTTIQKRIE